MNFNEELAMAGELELTDSELETVGGGHRRHYWPWWRRPDYDDYYWPYPDWDGGYSPFFRGGGGDFDFGGGGGGGGGRPPFEGSSHDLDPAGTVEGGPLDLDARIKGN